MVILARPSSVRQSHCSTLEFSMLKFALCCFLELLLLGSNAADIPESYLLQSQSLPEDLNYMPSLANGHLGYTVLGDGIFMNGVYNGAAGESKRARIPNWLNISATVCDRFGCSSAGNDVTANGSFYELNLRDGYYRSRHEFAALGVTLEQRTYPHRFYNRALVFEVIATRMSGRSNAPLFLQLTQQAGNDSDAFDWTLLNAGSAASGDHRVLHGRTQVIEQERFQPELSEIYALFSESLVQTRQFEWPAWQAELRHRVIIAIDREQSVARKDLDDALLLDEATLLQRHAQVWHEFWDEHFSIEIEGDLELWRTVNAGIFYLASALPSLSSTNQPNEPFYGLSPTGLAADYHGHNLWDSELWLLPVVSQFHLGYGQLLLDYRHRMLEGAKYNAHTKGYQGARYPRASAYSGTEVTAQRELAQQEIHISSDIVFALEKYFAMANDYDWLCARAWPIALEVAQFLVSRAACEDLRQECHLLNVMGPDAAHPDVDDNVYTNAVSRLALDFALWVDASCGNGSNAALQADWRHLRNRLLILRDVDLDYHPLHRRYQLNDAVHQADAILLGYPLQFDTSETHHNDLHYYANVTNEAATALTWSLFAANYLTIGQTQLADEYFQRAYKSYVRSEFKVWGEYPEGHAGSANYLTGIGGFLQALIFGYGGLNFARVGDKSQLQRRGFALPPNVERVSINYIKFAESKCSFQFQRNGSSINCLDSSGIRYQLDKGKQLGSELNPLNPQVA